jgi:hypothetical protein
VKVLGRIILILIVSAAVASCLYLLVRSTGGGQDQAGATAEFGQRDLRGRSYLSSEMEGSFKGNFEMRRGRHGEFSEFGREDEASIGRGLAGMLGNLILIGVIGFAVAKTSGALSRRSRKQEPAETSVS